MKKYILIAGVLGFALFAKSKLDQLVNGLEYGFGKLKVINKDWTLIQEVKMSLGFFIKNSSNITLNVQNFNGGLYYGEYRLATLKLALPIILKQGQRQDGNIDIKITNADTIGEIMKMISNGDYFNKIVIRGVLVAEEMTLDIDFPIKLAS